jgi:hypothetical protein
MLQKNFLKIIKKIIDRRKSCEALCKGGSTKLDPSLCLLPPLEGPCGGSMRRYFYDIEEGKCSEFRYGGCRGNPNNFVTKEVLFVNTGNVVTWKPF